MGIFNFRKNIENTNTSPEKKEEGFDLINSVIKLGAENIVPTITEKHNEDFVSYGINNDFPNYLDTLYKNAPTHQAIIDCKSLLVAGDGYILNDASLNDVQKNSLNQILKFIDGKNSLQKFLNETSRDLEMYGAICVEIIWSVDRTKWVKAKRISPKNIRSGKFVDGEIKDYFYSRDWTNRREKYTRIAAFDIDNKDDARQLLYVPLSLLTQEYYGEIDYMASLSWCALEYQTGNYYKSLMDNNFSPSMIVQFFRKPNSQEERDQVVKGLKQSFGGTGNSGKVMVTFSNDKDSAPEIKPVEVSSVDKQFTVLADQIQSKIVTGHRVTTSELFGINIPGKLGSADFPTQVEAFNKFVIRPSQIIVEEMINKLFYINGLNLDFKIIPLELDSIKSNQTQTPNN
jgi:hypothetical protein